MLRLKEYCDRVRDDAYGGSVELVEDGITAMANEIRATEPKDIMTEIEGYVDSVLAVTSPILPLIHLLNRCMCFTEESAVGTQKCSDPREAFLELLEEIRQEQRQCVDKIGKVGSRLIARRDKVATFSTSGSVMEILKNAVTEGKEITAAAFEARPNSEGYRTLQEISELGIPVTFGCDALLCKLVPGSKMFFIGADAISSTGEVYAKTGSYLAALVCSEFGIPFYVAADTSKFDSLSLLGFPIKDSLRPASEVTDMDIPEISEVINISFELIPAKLVTGIITEKGLISPHAVGLMMKPETMSSSMIHKLEAWRESCDKLI